MIRTQSERDSVPWSSLAGAMSAPTPFPDQPHEDPWGPQEPQWGSQPPQMGAPPLAGWWSRVGASILDGLIALGFLIIPVIIVAVLVSNGSDSGNTTISATRDIDTLFTVAFILIYYPLTTRRSGAHNGQTWGKQAL